MVDCALMSRLLRLSLALVVASRRRLGFEDELPGALKEEPRHRQVVAAEALRGLPLLAVAVDALQRHLVIRALLGLVLENAGLHALEPERPHRTGGRSARGRADRGRHGLGRAFA